MAKRKTGKGQGAPLVSRQLLWARGKRQRRLCVTCGTRKVQIVKHRARARCAPCAEVNRTAARDRARLARRAAGVAAWRPGGRGRPPLGAKAS